MFPDHLSDYEFTNKETLEYLLLTSSTHTQVTYHVSGPLRRTTYTKVTIVR